MDTLDKKIKKGMYGYRDAHKKRQILLVSLFLLVIAALLVSRYFITWKSLKNLVTISAILTVLPWRTWRRPGGLLEDPDRPQRAL